MQHAAAGLEKLVIQSVRRAPSAEGPLLAWPLVCGSVVAQRARAVAFEAGVLRVEIPDTGWKAELQALASRYLAALNRYTNEPVHKIEFVISSPERGYPGR